MPMSLNGEQTIMKFFFRFEIKQKLKKAKKKEKEEKKKKQEEEQEKKKQSQAQDAQVVSRPPVLLDGAPRLSTLTHLAT